MNHHRKGNKVSEAEIAEMRRLRREEGLMYKDIAKITGWHKATVHQCVNQTNPTRTRPTISMYVDDEPPRLNYRSFCTPEVVRAARIVNAGERGGYGAVVEFLAGEYAVAV